MNDLKEILAHYLDVENHALLSKLEGLGEYDLRRPLTPSGTNLLDLDAPGAVPPWGEHGQVTLGRILVHVATEVARHAGHADIVREQIDGAAGLRAGARNLPDRNQQWWTDYTARVEVAARVAAESAAFSG
ncbi:mycothiol transferase [Occultella gossypii]|uniref:DUF664 domain-containing protein n=1 Tax=Occultella gossypii TaxID=2800820 RepID=A0ABS7SA28_9MICO|nr:DUF664 domain-containing protein [Occultella gossypii]MBZ2196539.1 DUF664 domain-containing protein [Occultella gossypii]